MLHSDIGLFGRSSDSWDTDCARKFLQIPEEELKKLDSIPGWSTKQEINKQQEKSFQTVEGLPTSQLKTPEKTVNQLRNIQNINVSGVLVPKSALPPRKKSKISSTEKQLFHSIPLCNNNEVEDSFEIPISKESSAPDIYTLEEERPPLRKSGLENISSNMSTEQITLSQSNKSSVEKTLLDTTYVVPSVLEDKTNDITIVSNAQSQTSSSPVKISTKKRIFESSEIDSTNQPKFGGLPVFPTNTMSLEVSHENILSKKLRLLEKRFSPSKDLRFVESQYLIKEVSKAAGSFNSIANIHTQEVSLEPENRKVADIPSAKEKDVGSEVKLSEKEYVEVASTKSNANVFEEESFVSQPIPCGQPPPNVQPHSSTQLPIKLQLSVKESMAEKANRPHVLSEKRGNQVEIQELISVEGSKVGRKRKLKSKGENTSRKPSGKKPIVVVQYTAEQIRNMIEIMKNFQSKI